MGDIYDEPTQTELRQMLSVWALAYEMYSTSLTPDVIFDRYASRLDTNAVTEDEELDKFFNTCYSNSSGMWVLGHPRISELHEIVQKRVAQYKKVNRL